MFCFKKWLCLFQTSQNNSTKMRFPHNFGRFSMKSLEKQKHPVSQILQKNPAPHRYAPPDVAAPHEKEIDGLEISYPFKNGDLGYLSGQITTFHQPGFSWNHPFGKRIILGGQTFKPSGVEASSFQSFSGVVCFHVGMLMWKQSSQDTGLWQLVTTRNLTCLLGGSSIRLVSVQISMVIVSPVPNGRTSWLINAGY